MGEADGSGGSKSASLYVDFRGTYLQQVVYILVEGIYFVTEIPGGTYLDKRSNSGSDIYASRLS